MEQNDKPSDAPSDVRNRRARLTGITAVVPYLDPMVREFAERQVFSAPAVVEPASGPPRSFDRVVAELHDSEINVGLQSFCFCGTRVWIGDPVNGIRAEASFAHGDKAWSLDGSISQWLHETAIQMFPDSPSATAHATARTS